MESVHTSVEVDRGMDRARRWADLDLYMPWRGQFLAHAKFFSSYYFWLSDSDSLILG